MRWLAAVLMVAGCANAPVSAPYVLTPADHARLDALNAQEAAARQRRDAADPNITPEQRARRSFEDSRTAREGELLERALSGSPDYTAAVKRAATANVDGEAAIPAAPGSPRRPAMTARAREAAIATEEARLSEVVEARRRQRLAEQAMQARSQQDQMAVAICRARGQVAGSQPVFGGFGIAGAINAGMQQGWAAANAEAACINAYQQTGIMPGL